MNLFATNGYKSSVNKQQIDFDGWVGDEIGGINFICLSIFFNLSDIILDLNTKQPKGQILKLAKRRCRF